MACEEDRNEVGEQVELPPGGQADARSLIASMLGGGEKAISRLVVPTGLPTLDDALGGGLHHGMTVLTGLPNVGKTTLAVQIMCEAIRRNAAEAELESNERRYICACYYDLERDARYVTEKTICQFCDGKLTLDEISKPPESFDEAKIEALVRAKKLYGWTESDVCGIYSARDITGKFDDTFHDYLDSYSTPNQVLSIGAGCKSRCADYGDCAGCPDAIVTANGGKDEVTRADVGLMKDQVKLFYEDWGKDWPCLLVVDSLQQVRATGYPKEPTRRIECAVEDLKALLDIARHGQNIAVLAVSMMSKDGFSKPKEMEAVNGSAFIVHEADVIVSLYDATPAEVEDLNLSDKQNIWLKDKDAHIVIAHMVKSQSGTKGKTVPLVFDEARARFLPIRRR